MARTASQANTLSHKIHLLPHLWLAIGSYESFHVLTRQESGRGVQLRSSFAQYGIRLIMGDRTLSI
jgi:hypothetical protein